MSFSSARSLGVSVVALVAALLLVVVVLRPDSSGGADRSPSIASTQTPTPGRATGARREAIARRDIVTRPGVRWARVLEAGSGDPIPGATLLVVGSDGRMTVVGTSEPDGVLDDPDFADWATCIVHHGDYEVATVERSEFDAHPDIRLRRRPVVSCVLENVPPAVAVAFDFEVVVEGADDSLMTRLGQALDLHDPEGHQWSGLSELLVRPLRYGEATVVVHAMKPGDPASIARATVRLDVQEPFHRAWFRFVPEMSTTTLDVELDALFRFPHDVEVIHAIRGPTAGPGGPPMSSVCAEGQFDGSSNVRVVHRASGLTPGTYEWEVMATGFGTFAAGRFRVTANRGRITLRNEESDFVTGFLEVSAPQTGRLVDVRVFDGMRTVTGHVFPEAAFGHARTARWEYTVARGTSLWAIGYVDQDLCSRPVRLDSTRSGGVAIMRDWVPQRVVAFRLGDDPLLVDQLRWLRIEEAETGYVLMTRAIQGSPTARIGLPEGTYEVYACWDGGHGAPQPFVVSERTPTIVIRP